MKLKLAPYRRHRREVRKVGHGDGLCRGLLRQRDMQVIRSSTRVEHRAGVDVRQVRSIWPAFESFCQRFQFQNSLCRAWKIKKSFCWGGCLNLTLMTYFKLLFIKYLSYFHFSKDDELQSAELWCQNITLRWGWNQYMYNLVFFKLKFS